MQGGRPLLASKGTLAQLAIVTNYQEFLLKTNTAPIVDGSQACVMEGHRDEGRALLVGLDFGGSLIKIAAKTGNDAYVFHYFGAEAWGEALGFVLDLLKRHPRHRVRATGGGIHRLLVQAQKLLGTEILVVDEMQALVSGVLLRQAPGHTYPFLLVNVGSGVSIIKVSAEGAYSRISGTSLGGGTFRGLACLLSGNESIEQNLQMAAEGCAGNADLTVGDIYGSDYASVGLAANVTACAFGKLGRCAGAQAQPSTKDKLAALLALLCGNLAQIVTLNATLCNVTSVYFSGGFLAGHECVREKLAGRLDYWSKGSIKPTFLGDAMYLGAMGAANWMGQNGRG